jgi:hypothetical protein
VPEEKREREKKALTSGTALPERGKRGAGARAGENGNGPAWPMRKKERKRWWAGLREGNWAALFFSFSSFLFLSYTQTNSLNSNRFEFKPCKLNTRKIMLQHECTNMLTLVLFSCVINCLKCKAN